MKRDVLPLDRLEIEINLLNDILDELARKINPQTNLLLMDIRLRKQLAKVNLEIKYRNYQ